LGNILALEDGTVGDVARDARLAVADDAFAYTRPHPIAADQGPAFDRFTVVERARDVAAMILERIHAPAGFKSNEIALLTRLQERAVNIGAMGHAVRLTELFQERIAERDICNQLASQRVAHFLGWGAMGVGENRVLQPDFLQNPENIRPK